MVYRLEQARTRISVIYRHMSYLWSHMSEHILAQFGFVDARARSLGVRSSPLHQLIYDPDIHTSEIHMLMGRDAETGIHTSSFP